MSIRVNDPENDFEMIEKTTVHRLFCQHYSEMMRLARTMLYDDEEAEDVVQDVFVRLMETDILPAEGKTRAYLLTAVRNGSLNRIRQKSLTEQVKHLYTIEAQCDSLSVDEQMQTIEAICHYAETRLQEPHRTIFRLRYEDDMKLKDIALQMDMNLKTVFKALSQAIQSIRKHYRH